MRAFILSVLVIPALLSTQGCGHYALVGKWDLLSFRLKIQDGQCAVLMPNGKVLIFHGGNEEDDPVIFDPLTNSVTAAASTNGHRHCSMPVLAPDGRVFSIGGRDMDWNLLRSVEAYSFWDDVWANLAEMNVPRWYPSALVLSDGSILVMGGRYLQDPKTDTDTCELYDPKNPDAGWQETGSMLNAGNFPSAVLLMTGEVLAIQKGVAQIYNPATEEWRAAGALQEKHSGCNLVVLPGGRAMAIGGDTNACEIYDPEIDEWSYTGAMAHSRHSPHSVILPTGEVLVVGGEEGGRRLRTCEIYNPETGTWREVASMNRRRGHHSSATLLCDGRVLAVGEPNRPEVYQPPYLFWGIRPEILKIDGQDATSPETHFFLTRGSAVSVEVSSESKIVRVVLVGTNATTHHVDGGHSRYVPLSFEASGTTLKVSLAQTPEVVPPGWYQLVVLRRNALGLLVPSEGRMVRVE